MFATLANTDPWRLHHALRRPPTDERPAAQVDLAISVVAGLILLAVVAPSLAIGLVGLTLFGGLVWLGVKVVGPLTQPLVEGVSPSALGSLPYNFAR